MSSNSTFNRADSHLLLCLQIWHLNKSNMSKLEFRNWLLCWNLTLLSRCQSQEFSLQKIGWVAIFLTGSESRSDSTQSFTFTTSFFSYRITSNFSLTVRCCLHDVTTLKVCLLLRITSKSSIKSLHASLDLKPDKPEWLTSVEYRRTISVQFCSICTLIVSSWLETIRKVLPFGSISWFTLTTFWSKDLSTSVQPS